MEKSLYFVYVLRNPDGRLYIGFTADLERRVRQHQEGEGGWTQERGPWELVYHEKFDNRAEAMKRERNLKRGRPNMELRKHLAQNGRAGPSGTGRINR
jgi:putative endonuclease